MINDPDSEPLSNRYFVNSEEPRIRSRGGSLIETRYELLEMLEIVGKARICGVDSGLARTAITIKRDLNP